MNEEQNSKNTEDEIDTSDDPSVRLISREEFDLFLDKNGVHLKCPICGTEQFGMETDKENLNIVPVTFYINLVDPSIFRLPSFYPIINLTCKKCHYILSFSHLDIAKWLDANNG